MEHCFHIVVPVLVSLVGAVIMISTLNLGARYFSMILLCTGPFVGLNVSKSLLEILIVQVGILTILSDSNCMGNYRCSTTEDKTCSTGSHRQLCLISITLVYAVFLSTLAGASIPDRGRDPHSW